MPTCLLSGDLDPADLLDAELDGIPVDELLNDDELENTDRESPEF